MWSANTPGGNSLPMAATGIDTNMNPVMERTMYVEPVIAYRCWLVDAIDGAPGLRSWTQSVPWRPHEEVQARCLRASIPAMMGLAKHDSPNVHGCGIYGVRTMEQAKKWFSQSGVGILGVVKMWGRVIVCSDGFLAEFAYPAALLISGKGLRNDVFVGLVERYSVVTEWAS